MREYLFEGDVRKAGKSPRGIKIFGIRAGVVLKKFHDPSDDI